MSLRNATDQDLAHIIPWIDSAEACLLWAGPKVAFPMTVASLRREIGVDDDNTFVLTAEDGPAAFGQLLRRDDGLMHLARILVDPARRGGGYGRRLCESLVTQAVERGSPGVTLFVYRHNQPARHLYAALGFNEIAERSSDSIVFMYKPLVEAASLTAGG